MGKDSYTLEEIKSAFYETFHESGEVFFDYLSSEMDNEYATFSKWTDLEENLTKKGD